MTFFKILFDYYNSFSLLIKIPYIFLPKKQRIFENFEKSMMSCLSKFKVTPKFCFPFKISDDPTASNVYVGTNKSITIPIRIRMYSSQRYRQWLFKKAPLCITIKIKIWVVANFFNFSNFFKKIYKSLWMLKYIF